MYVLSFQRVIVQSKFDSGSSADSGTMFAEETLPQRFNLRCFSRANVTNPAVMEAFQSTDQQPGAATQALKPTVYEPRASTCEPN